MRLSQINIEKIKSQRSKARSSRSEFQSTTRSKIREKEKKRLEEELVKSSEYQTKTEKFFKEEKEKKLQEFRRQQKISPISRIENKSINSSFYESRNIYFNSIAKGQASSKLKNSHKFSDYDIRKAQNRKKQY